MNKFLFFLFLIIVSTGIVSASFGYDNPTIPKINSLPVVTSSGTGGGDTYITNNYYNGSSYNATYEGDIDALYFWLDNFQYDYNSSIPFYNWVGSFQYNYNQSSIFSYNHTSICTAYTDSKVYNFTTATYNMYGLNWYNHSNIDSKKFWYNMTSTGSSVTFPNCGANEVLTNRTGGLTCVTDQTGGVGSAPADDLSVNLSQGIVVYEQFLTASAIETGEMGSMGWVYVGTVTSNAPYSGNHPGTVKVSTSTTSNSNNSLDLGSNTMMIDATSGNMTWCYLLNVSHPPAMTDNYTLIVGLHDFTATASQVVDGMAFIVNTTLTNWTIVQRANGNMWLNTTNWGINGSWNKLCGVHQNVSGLYRNSYYINGQLVTQTNMTSMPYGSARAFGTGITLKKYGGTTARTVDVDYYYFKQLFQVPRE